MVTLSPETPKAVESKPPSRNKRTTGTQIFKPVTDMAELGTLQLRPAEDQIRVPVSKLDRLMAEVSELLIARMHGEERQNDLKRLHKHTHRWAREWRAVRTAYIRMARRLQNEAGELPDEMMVMFRFLESNQYYLAETNRLLGILEPIHDTVQHADWYAGRAVAG